MKNRENEYSPCIDCLLDWGRSFLFEGEKSGMLREAVARWETAERSSTSMDLGVLEEKAGRVLDFLRGPDTLDLDEKDAGKVLTALEILDDTVFLIAALDHFSDLGRIPDDFQRRAEKVHERSVMDMPPPYLRLVPLNAFRTEILENMPREVRDLFPWYVKWSELPEDFFEHLADERGRIAWNRIEPPVPEGVQAELTADLVSDRELAERIRRDCRMFGLISESVGENFALRLLSIRMETVDNMDSGGAEIRKHLNCAAAGIFDAPLEPGDRMERLFLAAFCGSFPGNGIRLEIFHDVEDWLKTHRGRQTGILETVLSWSAGKTADSELSKAVFERWDEVLADEARRIDKSDVLRKAVMNARLSKIPEAVKQKTGSELPFLAIAKEKATEFFIGYFPLKAFSAAVLVCLALLLLYKPDESPKKNDPISKIRKPIAKKVPKKKLPEILLGELDLKKSPQAPGRESRPDPFVPLVKSESEPGKTALEKIGIEKLRLVAVILFPGGKRALLEDDFGMGHIVEQGSPVGTRGGRIAEIHKDRIVIDEFAVDGFGKKVRAPRELFLKKW